MTKQKVIFWDWDNTLVDTFGAIWLAQNDMRQHYGLSAWTKEDAKIAMNKSGKNLIRDVLGEDKAEEARAYYLKCYAERSKNLHLKEGAPAILALAKSLGFINILASNKTTEVLQDEVKRFKLTKSFNKIVGAGSAKEDKPSKIFTDTALEGYTPELIVSIGDGASDIKMGHNYKNGRSILLFTNVQSPEFKENQPDYAAPDFATCQRILTAIANNHASNHASKTPQSER